MNPRILAAALGAAALVLPTAAAVAHPQKTKKAKSVSFVFKGTFTAPGTVEVLSGNAHVRKGGFVGQDVTFDLTAAKVIGKDTNGDEQVDLTDVGDGDKVLVRVRVAKGTQHASTPGGSLVARKLIDKTRAP
jgi:hypothetical protein